MICFILGSDLEWVAGLPATGCQLLAFTKISNSKSSSHRHFPSSTGFQIFQFHLLRYIWRRCRHRQLAASSQPPAWLSKYLLLIGFTAYFIIGLLYCCFVDAERSEAKKFGYTLFHIIAYALLAFGVPIWGGRLACQKASCQLLAFTKKFQFQKFEP